MSPAVYYLVHFLPVLAFPFWLFFWNDEAIKALEGVTGIMFLQQPDGAPWKILVNDTTMFKEVYFDFPEEEFRRMLANSNVILPGEPGFIPPVQA